jgi:hypothetical protein
VSASTALEFKRLKKDVESAKQTIDNQKANKKLLEAQESNANLQNEGLAIKNAVEREKGATKIIDERLKREYPNYRFWRSEIQAAAVGLISAFGFGKAMTILKGNQSVVTNPSNGKKIDLRKLRKQIDNQRRK